MKRNSLAVGALIAAPLLLTACGNADTSNTTADGRTDTTTSYQNDVVYPKAPSNTDEMLECDKGAPIIASAGAVADTSGEDLTGPATPLEAGKAFAEAGSVRPEYGTDYEIIAQEDDGYVLGITYKDKLVAVASASEIGRSGVWHVTTSAMCTVFVDGGDK